MDATTNACLGLVGGEVWTRPGVVTEHHRDRPFEDRESHRWLAAAERAREVLQPAAMITVVSDREGGHLSQMGRFAADRRACVDTGHGGPPLGWRRHTVCRTE